jgi:hypothetical protein
MKKKLVLFLLMVAGLTYQASAWVIILQGGGTNHRFNYVRMTSRRLECRGNGSLTCPVDFGNLSGQEIGVFHKSEDVINYVMEQVTTGKTSGEVKYENDLPVRWNVLKDKSVEIDIDEKATEGLKYEPTE